MRAISALTSGGTARPFASSRGGDVDLICAALPDGDKTDLLTNGSGSLPSDLKYISGRTAKTKAITKQTVMMNRLSMVKKRSEERRVGKESRSLGGPYH